MRGRGVSAIAHAVIIAAVFLLAQAPELLTRSMTVETEFAERVFNGGYRELTIRRINAMRADGSFMRQEHFTGKDGLFAEALHTRFDEMWFPIRAVRWQVNYQTREITESTYQPGSSVSPRWPPLAGLRPLPQGLGPEGACAVDAVRNLRNVRRVGSGMAAGFAIERFRGKPRNDIELDEVEMGFAPAFGCWYLEWIGWRIGFLRWSVYSDRVTSIRFGEPDPALFQAPANYTRKRY